MSVAPHPARPPGRGFKRAPFTNLPAHLLDVLQLTSTLAAMMDTFSPVDHVGHQEFLTMRSVAHHRLLTLPAWHEAGGVAIMSHLGAVYECSRLTAISVSNAVLLGIPPSTGGWATTLCSSLIPSLDRLLAYNYSTVPRTFLLWIATLGGMMSEATPSQHEYFKTLLRSAWADPPLTPSAELSTDLDAFMWSERVCGRGAMLFRDKCGCGRATAAFEQSTTRTTG